jgi:hypothetical protein
LLFDILSFDILSFDILSFNILSFDILSFDILSFDILSFDILLFDILSFNILSFDILLVDILTLTKYCMYVVPSKTALMGSKVCSTNVSLLSIFKIKSTLRKAVTEKKLRGMEIILRMYVLKRARTYCLLHVCTYRHEAGCIQRRVRIFDALTRISVTLVPINNSFIGKEVFFKCQTFKILIKKSDG